MFIIYQLYVYNFTNFCFYAKWIFDSLLLIVWNPSVILKYICLLFHHFYVFSENWNIGILLSSSPVFSGVRVTWSLLLYVCFLDRCLFFCTFSFGHCVVCSSSIYGFWLTLWYLQTLLLEPWKSLLFTNQLSNWEDLIGQSIIL
jgi:hypothetical protein